MNRRAEKTLKSLGTPLKQAIKQGKSLNPTKKTMKAEIKQEIEGKADELIKKKNEERNRMNRMKTPLKKEIQRGKVLRQVNKGEEEEEEVERSFRLFEEARRAD